MFLTYTRKIVRWAGIICLMEIFTVSITHVCIAQVQDAEVRVGPFLQHAEPTSIWIVWETTADADSVIHYGPTRAVEMHAHGQSIASHKNHRIHHVELTGLKPDTPYFYRVPVEGERGAVFRFRTPPERKHTAHPFRFVVYSDTQSGPFDNKHTEVINDGVIAFMSNEFGGELSDQLAFTMISGDLVDDGTVYEQWKEQFFDEEQNVAQHVPLYPVPGNHERDAHWFFDYFHLPENGSPEFLEHWWYKDYSNVRVIGIDSNSDYQIDEQLDWLDSVLADAAEDLIIDFVFAQMHHPHKTPAWTPGNTEYTGEIIQRLEAFSTRTGKPSIHFFGHTHAYERGQSRDHNHLWVDVSAGEGDLAWWGEYPREDYQEFQKVFMDWGFVLMDVEDGDNPSFRLRRVTRGNQFDPKDNEILDDITIRHHNESPLAPDPEYPSSDATETDAEHARVSASTFNDPDGDSHLASHFQLTTSSGDYTNPSVDHWIRFENWYAPENAVDKNTGYYSVDTRAGKDVRELEIGPLDPYTTYYWRVRYRDSALAWSEWSSEGHFTTGAAVFGAACLPEGGCEILREFQSDALGAVWMGANTDCASGLCPEFVTVWTEDFENIALNQPVAEAPSAEMVWSPIPPDGWTNDRSAMPDGGVEEWRDWSFAKKDWWIQISEDQGRAAFERGSGIVAIADTDEYHDTESVDEGPFDASLSTNVIPLTVNGKPAPSARFAFDSTWMPHAEMHATLTAHYDNGDSETLLDWRSKMGVNHKGASPNERVVVQLNNPPDASAVTFTFRLSNAGNDWYWAIDNLRLLLEIE